MKINVKSTKSVTVGDLCVGDVFKLLSGNAFYMLVELNGGLHADTQWGALELTNGRVYPVSLNSAAIKYEAELTIS